MGVITNKGNLGAADKLTASALCRRRLPVVLVRLKMAETLKEAVTFVEQGRIRDVALFMFVASHMNFFSILDLRVGPEVVTDPAFLVTRYVLTNLHCSSLQEHGRLCNVDRHFTH